MTEAIPDVVRRAFGLQSVDFDRLFPGERDRCIKWLAICYSELLEARKREGPKPGDHFEIAWHYVFDAANSMIAAFLLFERGFEAETLGVARSAVERIASALVLFDNPALVTPFLGGRIRGLGPKAISSAGRVISNLGPLYGELSDLGAHVGRHNIGTGVVRDPRGKAGGWAIGGNLPSEDDQERVEAWRFVVNLLNSIAEQLLSRAPFEIFGNQKRVRTHNPFQRFRPGLT